MFICLRSSLWALTSQWPARYPETSDLVKWQWKSINSAAFVDSDTRNGCILPRFEKGTHSMSVFASLQNINYKRKCYKKSILTYWVKVRFAIVLCFTTILCIGSVMVFVSSTISLITNSPENQLILHKCKRSKLLFALI